MNGRFSLVGVWVSGLMTVALVGTAHAAAPKPTMWLGEQITAVRALVAPATPVPAAEQDAKLKALVDPVMEFETLSERALGKHWATLKPEQRKVFVDTFRELVFRSYLKKVRGANNDYTLTFEGESLTGASAKVEAVAKTKKAEIELVFTLEPREDKRWIAADVTIDEVSLVENYREQFNKTITTDGFDALISKMKKKLAEI
jgi:phospholipid transport system substrate-binding protein